MDKRKYNGGARKGAGRPALETPTTTVSFRIDEVAYIHAKAKHGNLNQQVNKLIKKLAK